MGLISSGRGRTGDPGDFDMRSGIFQGVRETDVSNDGRGGLRLRGAEKGVWLPKREASGVLTATPSRSVTRASTIRSGGPTLIGPGDIGPAD